MLRIFWPLLFAYFFLTQRAQAGPQSPSIGAILPLTGPLAGFGKQAKNGMDLAQDALKSTKNPPILYLEDTHSTTQGTLESIHKLHKIHGTAFVLGEIGTANTEAAAAYAKTNGIMLLSVGSGQNRLTEKNRWAARVCFNNNFQSRKMAQFALKKIGQSGEKIAIMEQKGSLFSQENAQGFIAEFKQLGGKITVHQFYSPQDTDYKVLLKSIKKAKVKHVYLPDYYPQAALWVKQARELGMDITFYGVDGWESREYFELAEKGASGHYIISHFSPENKSPLVVDFVTRFEKKYGYKPGVLDALGYDSLMLAVQVLNQLKKEKSGRGDKNNAENIRTELLNTSHFNGVTGDISLDKNGNTVKPAFILKTLNKGYSLEETILP